MDTQGIFITCHAMLRYVQRVLQQPVGEDYSFSGQEINELYPIILGHIERGICLPTHCCLLFVQPKRSGYRATMRTLDAFADGTLARSGTVTSWGRYIYDGTICVVMEKNRVMTVIIPDEAQHTMLEELLTRANPSELPPALRQPTPPPENSDQQMAHVLGEALRINEQQSSEASGPKPPPVYLELLRPKKVFSSGRVSPKFVALFLRWIGRVVPARAGKRTLLLLDTHYRFFAPYVALLEGNGLDTQYLPEHINSGKSKKSKTQLLNRSQLCKLLTKRSTEYAHIFILGARPSVRIILQFIHEHVGYVYECTESHRLETLGDDTAFVVDIENPDPFNRVSRFQP